MVNPINSVEPVSEVQPINEIPKVEDVRMDTEMKNISANDILAPKNTDFSSSDSTDNEDKNNMDFNSMFEATQKIDISNLV